MSRRLTGWVLTAAVIAALPAPALSSNDSSTIPGRDFKPTVVPSVVGEDGDFTNCFEVTPVLQPQGRLPGMAAGKGPPVDIYVREHPTEGIAGEIARAKRGAADQAMPGSLLIDRTLTPNGTARPDQIKAACGIPGGLTLLPPAAGGRGGA
jgi:hypothetical protein